MDAHEDDEEEEEIFFGPSSDKEKAKARKFRRKTEIFKPNFREDQDDTDVVDAGTMDDDRIEEASEGNDDPEGSDDTTAPATDDVSFPTLSGSGKLSPKSTSPQPSREMPDSSGKKTYLEESSRNSASLTGSTQSERSPGRVQMRERGSISAVDVNTPLLHLVPTSPQSEQRNGSAVSGEDEVELFSATEEVNSVGIKEIDSSLSVSQSSALQDAVQPSMSDSASAASRTRRTQCRPSSCGTH